MAGQVLWLTRLQMNPRTLEAATTRWTGDRPAAGDQVCPSVLKQMTGKMKETNEQNLGCCDFRSINISGHDTLDWRPTSCWRSKSVPFSVEANGWRSSWLSRLQMNPPNIRSGQDMLDWRPTLAAGDQVCPSVLKQMTGHVLGCRDFRSINISGHDTLDWRPTSCWRSKSVPFSVEANGWPSSWLSRLQMNPPNIRSGRQAGNGEMRALPPVV